MDDKPAKPKRIGNHYIPPPARKQGTEPHDFSRIKERPSKLGGTRQEKLCDDSSLLFKDSSPKVEEKTKAKRKSKRANKKANAENTAISMAAETQPVLPSYADCDKAIFQHCAPHDACDASDKVLVKSHLPLNDLENNRSRDANNLETPVRFMDNDFDSPKRLVVIPCSITGHRANDGIKGNDANKAELRADVEEIPEAACDNVSESEVYETEYPIESGACNPQEEGTCKNIEEVSLENNLFLSESNDLVVTKSNTQAVSTCADLPPTDVPESRSGSSNVVGSAFTMGCKPNMATDSAPVVSDVSNSNDPVAKTRPPSDCCQYLSSVDDGDWDSIYDDSGDCLIPLSGASSPKGSPSQVEKDLAKMKISPKQPIPEKVYENCSSIIEIYGFSEELKTNDLLSVFGSFINKGFNLKWVDNTHALGIFPSPFLAEEVLISNLPLVKTRPIAQGTPLSQEKARTLVLPSSLRPKTCSALARRLVSGALGLRVKATPEERAAERELLREAREKKKLVSKQRDAAWEGNFSSSDGCEEKGSS